MCYWPRAAPEGLAPVKRRPRPPPSSQRLRSLAPRGKAKQRLNQNVFFQNELRRSTIAEDSFADAPKTGRSPARTQSNQLSTQRELELGSGLTSRIRVSMSLSRPISTGKTFCNVSHQRRHSTTSATISSMSFNGCGSERWAQSVATAALEQRSWLVWASVEVWADVEVWAGVL